MATFDTAVPAFIPTSRVTELLNGLYTCATSEECVSIAADLGGTVKALGVQSLETCGVLDNLRREAQNKKSGLAREGALLGIAGLARVLGRPAEPYLVPMLPMILDLYADKGAPVQEAAENAALAISALPSQYATTILLPIFFEAMTRKWQTRIGALQLLGKLASVAPGQIGAVLPEIIPNVSDCLHDTKNEVAAAATKCMMAVAKVAGNPDIEPHIPILVSCMAHPTEVPQCIQKLSATTFVAEVTGPALAIMVPLLVRALNERSAAVLRQTVIITDNLCKLVNDPADAGQFLPQLLPGLNRIVETAASPEVRSLATAARTTLINVGGAGSAEKTEAKPTKIVASREAAMSQLKNALSTSADVKSGDAVFATTVEYVSTLVSELIAADSWSAEEWKTTCLPYLAAFLPEKTAQEVVLAVHAHYMALEKERRKAQFADDEDDGTEEVCNCDFSLAYGTRMLLNKTTLRLKRGHRYGLCGANGAGKSTLMRAIAENKVENFPPPDVLRSIYVEHVLQGEDGSMAVVDFIASDKNLKGLDRKKIVEALESVGFDGDRQKQAVGSLSGGWKMKLELARAMLTNADILLLDEPTNHLDVANVAWLENWLIEQKNVTALIVSHDSGFLDNVCTDIVHYERKKLAYYKGNLTEFVKKRPEAKTYFILSDSAIKFVFPPPGFLQGINSKTKAILKMTDITFTYPGAAKPSLYNASVTLSLSSRVAILGPNGAGKSTMIKVLTGETTPQSGTVWKHPNLRIGYVAQHAFHHLEQHLEKTPNQYIQWRYFGGEDREVLEKESRKMSEHDLAAMETLVPVPGRPGEKRKIECILGRQKLKKSFQYEVKWVGFLPKHNSQISREELLERGFTKLVQAFDDREASREGQSYRELNPAIIRKHFEEVGLDGDIADNNLIGSLSGGQKVKVVIAAAMWNNPHMLVLDEPTNFLDRDSLGGLAVAIRDWGGAVVMISHNAEFVGALCPEVYNVEAGRMSARQRTGVADAAFEDAAATEAMDEAAQKKIEAKVKAKSGKKKLTRNELKAREARRRARHLKWLAEGGVKEPDTDED
ncbi:hypothetical protein HK104_010757 [Borealophlyctis nickersoniae]|nr:hypothetical protein HK104_010757 [Borealophlyctis nickersoniae]